MMKKIYRLFILVLTMAFALVVLTGCNVIITDSNTSNGAENKNIDNDKDKDDSNDIIVLSNNLITEISPNNEPDKLELETITFVIGDYNYNYPNVVTSNINININSICEKYNLLENDHYLIDNFYDLKLFYSSIMGMKIDPAPLETQNGFYEDKVQILVYRKASASNYIKANYYYIQSDNSFIAREYLHENESGDLAIFDCFDLIIVPREVYNYIYNIM